MKATLSLAEARRTALAAQGFATARPDRTPGMADLMRVVRRLGVLQIDSVNVLARAHLLPAYSRLGPYDPSFLDRATSQAPRKLTEYWAHVAAYIPVETYPLFAFRQQAHAAEDWSIAGEPAQTSAITAQIRELVAETGPATARDLQAHFAHLPRRTDAWGWNWSVAKHALEYLFFAGELGIAGRTPSFERRYDLIDRVLPPAVRALPEPDQATAYRHLVDIAARALGIGTVRCFADYFRLAVAPTKTAVDELAESGILHPVTVRGWERPTFRHDAARTPRGISARALVAPFDPLVFERRRLAELFGMRYRIGIYTPADRRDDGYYVLPFLLGDRFAARVDLKADRAAGRLVVHLASTEPDAPPPVVVAGELAAELRDLAVWLGLERIDAADARGDLAGPLKRAVRG